MIGESKSVGAVHFDAVGDGPERPHFEAKKTELGIPNFHFLGNRLDIPAIMRRITINVLATRNEGLSIMLLEAMTAGSACIASDIPGNCFALDGRNSGTLVQGHEPTALAAAIERLLVDQAARQELIKGASERSKYFASERMATDYIDLYIQLL